MKKWISDDPYRFGRFYCIPFCVSSLSAIANGKSGDFFLIFPKDVIPLVIAIGAGLGTPLSVKLLNIYYSVESKDPPVMELDVQGTLPKTVVLRSTENEAKEEYERVELNENGCL